MRITRSKLRELIRESLTAGQKLNPADFGYDEEFDDEETGPSWFADPAGVQDEKLFDDLLVATKAAIQKRGMQQGDTISGAELSQDLFGTYVGGLSMLIDEIPESGLMYKDDYYDEGKQDIFFTLGEEPKLDLPKTKSLADLLDEPDFEFFKLGFKWGRETRSHWPRSVMGRMSPTQEMTFEDGYAIGLESREVPDELVNGREQDIFDAHISGELNWGDLGKFLREARSLLDLLDEHDWNLGASTFEAPDGSRLRIWRDSGSGHVVDLYDDRGETVVNIKPVDFVMQNDLIPDAGWELIEGHWQLTPDALRTGDPGGAHHGAITLSMIESLSRPWKIVGLWGGRTVGDRTHTARQAIQKMREAFPELEHVSDELQSPGPDFLWEDVF